MDGHALTVFYRESGGGMWPAFFYHLEIQACTIRHNNTPSLLQGYDNGYRNGRGTYFPPI